ncbi:MAG: hypothetical protein FWD91_02205 [Treponema sp.]|nr:hypothetical protein [Treponema sp.]
MISKRRKSIRVPSLIGLGLFFACIMMVSCSDGNLELLDVTVMQIVPPEEMDKPISTGDKVAFKAIVEGVAVPNFLITWRVMNNTSVGTRFDGNTLHIAQNEKIGFLEIAAELDDGSVGTKRIRIDN